ncbi:hypothetical protein KAFR_0F04180 [Kazachstania africana CBS 2517]|uniref:PX domain-containing protein n=1 Tax=Kazachstania africana (strain ATCC 22294 / BCRC 22015 / CBS 2517 / CECT 1963 / NBRC 1671 / NRRL Y-8276) TaxID=1071382 RepID=H2AXB3_KAZAF|nr:hypothetical protein KAFR_0F04180 [Kazachstania africana CBS 2517]CCF59013.1 hypothetical protein KAFR_0F04180 [Kazachstania africana CBS 2517]
MNLQTQVLVPETQVVANSYTVYTFEMITKNSEGSTIFQKQVKKRYSDFVKLEKNLRNELSEEELPYSLPPRTSIFQRNASLDSTVTKQRKIELARFLYDLLNDSFDTKWRNSESVKSFLSLPTNWNVILQSDNGGAASGDHWMSKFRDCKNALEQCKSSHDTAALMHLRLDIKALDEEISADSVTLTSAELRRRKNLLGTMKNDLNELSLQTTSEKLEMPQEVTSQPFIKRSSTRNFCASPSMSNAELLQLQKDTTKEQNQDLDQLREVLGRQKTLLVEMNNELAQQNELLDGFNNDVDVTANKVKKATNNTKRFNDRL